MYLKKRFYKVLPIILFVNILFSGCASTFEFPRSSMTPVVPLQKPTMKPSATGTASIIPSVPPTSQTTTVTITPMATLSKEETHQTIRSMLKGDPTCLLPCFGGITPGETTWDSIKPFIMSRSIQIDPGSTKELLHVIRGQKTNEAIYVWLYFSERLNKVDGIQIKVQQDNSQQAFQSLLENFSPEKIVQEYGQPSRVLLSSVDYTLGPANRVSYTLWLFYDQQGFEIRYHGVTQYDPNTYHLCPKLGMGGDIGMIYFDIRSKESRDLLGKGDDVLESDYQIIKSFEAASEKTLDDFTQIFTQTMQPACFDIPREVWK